MNSVSPDPDPCDQPVKQLTMEEMQFRMKFMPGASASVSRERVLLRDDSMQSLSDAIARLNERFGEVELR